MIERGENTVADAPPSYAERAASGLRYLGELLELGPDFTASAAQNVMALFGAWGHRSARGIEESEQARRGAPFEYSLVLSGDRVDVRLFFRPLAAEGVTDASASWEQGWRTLTRLEQRGRAHLERARGLGDLFRPSSRQAAFGLCLAASVQPFTVGRVKVYFDTLAAGTERNRQVLAEALNRLGHGAAWSWLQKHDPAGMTHLMPAFFALDVDGSPDARVKFYTTVAERSTSQLGARLAPFSDTARRTAVGFLENTAARAAEPLARRGVRPTLCWSMTARCHHRPVDATLYLPFNQYAPESGETLSRLRKALAPRPFRSIERLVTRHAAVVPPNEPENPFHWAATKLVGGRGALSLYISAAAVDAARTAGH